MIQRIATCACGALSIEARGEPLKVSACHCSACQHRTGSAFGVAVFYDQAQTTASGPSRVYSRLGESGLPVAFHFCPTCGSSVFWRPAFRPGRIAIALGCFGAGAPGGPSQEVYEASRWPWVTLRLQ